MRGSEEVPAILYDQPIILIVLNMKIVSSSQCMI